MSETLNFPCGTGVVTGPLELTQQFTAAAEDGRPFQFHLQPDQIKRIARLLTEEHEKIERQAIQARYDGIPALLPDHTAEAIGRLVRWRIALESRQPISELRALEAAYLAATEAEQ